MTNTKKWIFAIATAACTMTTNPAMAVKVQGKEAMEISQLMYTGWNVGNSLDALANQTSTGLNTEIAWGNAKITKSMIDNVKNAGFRTLRIPVSWGQHTSNNGQYQFMIDDAWLKRVKEVVDYGIDNDMFVILNIHHDNGDQWNHPYFWPTNNTKNQSVKYVTDIWSQLAECFKEYDQKLIFETLNEPRLIGDQNEWWFYPTDNPSQQKVVEAMGVINAMNQAAVDAIRNNGHANNRDRMILIPGYDASPEGAVTNKFQMPNDPSPNRIGIEIHAYRPTELCLSGNLTYFQESDKQTIRDVLRPCYDKFVTRNIPVIIDETSISDKGQGDETRKQWIDAFYGIAKEYKMPCVLWDNGTTWATYQQGLKEGWSKPNENGECHGFMNRSTGQWNQPQMVQKIMDVMGEPPILMGIDEMGASKTNMVLTISSDEIRILKDGAIADVNSVTLFSLQGLKVASTEKVGTLSIASLPAGLYFVVVESNEGLFKEKIMIR